MIKKEQIFAQLQKLNLLFVDDDENIRVFGERLFERLFKNVKTAGNGKEAVELLKKHHFDIVLTDLSMPEMDGFELIRYIKEHDYDVYTVVLSAHFETDTLLKAINVGVDGFMIKPFDLEMFLKIMEKILYHKLKVEEELNILKQYKEIVDENMIVSKTDTKGIITYVNKEFEQISGFSADELLGKPHNIVRHPDMSKEAFEDLWKTIQNKKVWRGLVKNRKKNSEPYYVDTVIKPILDMDGNIKEFIALRKNVTNYISAEKLMNDKLQLIDHALLILVSIDNYKDIKIIYEEDVLTKLKIRLLKKIKIMIKERIGIKKENIEEYVINESVFGFLIENCNNVHVGGVLEEIVREIVNRPIIINGFEYYPFVRVSYAYGSHSHLYKNAMIGLEEIQNTEKRVILANGLCEKKKTEVLKNMSILKTIEEALMSNRIVSLFQPIINNKTKKPIKYESLVRIKDKDGKLITPNFFLDIAKKSGLYGNITLNVLDNAFKVMEDKQIPVSINLSPSDILREKIRDKIYYLLEKHRPLRDMITFELLEDEIIKYPKTLHEFVDKIIALGANIAIDDFGEGYSNFTRIIEIKAEIIKIDGSLVRGLDKDKIKQDVVESIVNFARKENKKTVAEYVENEAIYNKLVELGVDYSQGYYFSKPLLIEEI